MPKAVAGAGGRVGYASLVVVITGVILVALAWASAVERVRFERAAATEDAWARTSSYALAYEQQILRTLQTADQTVRYVRHVYQDSDRGVRITQAFEKGWISPELFAYAGVVDSSGRVVLDSSGAHSIDLSDREYFRFHAAHPSDELHIGVPVASRVDGRTAIQLTRRIEAADGFGGVALVALRPETFVDFQKYLNIGRQGLVIFAGLDGVARVLRMGTDARFGVDVRSGQLIQDAAGHWAGRLVGNGRIDGIPRFVSYRRLEDYPFIVAVGIPIDEALAEAAARAKHYYAAVGVASLLIGALAVVIVLGLRRQARAQVALGRSEERFRGLTELSSDFFWESDREHRLTARGSGGKPSAVPLFDRNQQIGRRRWEIPYLSPDENGWRAHKALLDAHQPFRDFEISRPAADGSERFISLSGDPVFDEEGSFIGYRGVGTDITRRKRAENELLESERRFRELLDHVELMSVMLDREGRITYCNDYLLHRTGWTRDEVLGHSWFEIFVPPDQPDIRPLFADLLADASSAWHHENEIVTREGGRRMVRWSNTVLRSPSGASIGTASIGEDVTERLLAERHVIQAEARYRATFDHAAVGMAHADLAGRLTRVNRALCAMLGYSEEELRLLTWSDVTHPDDVATSRKRVESLLENPELGFAEIEKLCLRKDGRVIWVVASVSVVRDENGAPDYIVSVLKDVTQVKYADAALRQRNELLRLFVQHVPLPVCMLDRGLHFLASSERFISDYRLGERPIVGRHFYEVFPEIPQRWRDVLGRCLAGETERCDEDRFERADGTVQWVRWEVLPWRDATGGIGGVLIFAEDITERHRAAIALRESEQRLAIAVEGGGLAAWERRLDTGESLWDERLAELLGLPPGRSGYVRRQWTDFIHADDRARVAAAFARACQSAEVFDEEFRVVRSDGAIRWFASRGMRLARRGEPRIAGVVQDVTERHEAAERMRELSARIVQSLEGERHRVSLELHDNIGQALTAVKLNLQAVQRAKTAAARHNALADCLGVADEAIESVRAMSHDLRPRILDELGLAPALAWYCERQSRRAGIALDYEGPGSDVGASGPVAVACYRIAQEAVTNTMRHARAKHARVTLKRRGERLSLEILDDGAGFDVRAARSHGNGHGALGIAGMEERARLAGGSLRITSRPGGGTRVRADFRTGNAA